MNMNRTVVGILKKDGKVLIVKRKKDDGSTWAFPGGKVEDGESIYDAVVREIREECGIECKPKKLLGSRVHPRTKAEIDYWLCEYVSGEAKIASPDEIQEIAWKTKDEIYPLFGSSLFEKVKEYLEEK